MRIGVVPAGRSLRPRWTQRRRTHTESPATRPMTPTCTRPQAIIEEPIHYLDLLLWYVRERRLPVEVLASGVASPQGPGMSDPFTATLTFADGRYAVFTQCLAGFQHLLMLDLAGTEGAIRTWWSGAMDRAKRPDFELKLQRAGARRPRSSPSRNRARSSSWRRGCATCWSMCRRARHWSRRARRCPARSCAWRSSRRWPSGGRLR